LTCEKNEAAEQGKRVTRGGYKCLSFFQVLLTVSDLVDRRLVNKDAAASVRRTVDGRAVLMDVCVYLCGCTCRKVHPPS